MSHPSQTLATVQRPQDQAPVDIFITDGQITSVVPAARPEGPVRPVWPAFVDAHCHILPTGLDLLKLTLAGCTSRDEVLDRVRDHARSLAPEEWLHAVHYDQNRFTDGEHLDRTALDTVAPNRPVLLRHVNGHASVANTAALRAAGVNDGTLDPSGGAYVRDISGSLTGVLLEQAHEAVSKAAPHPRREEMVTAILRAGASMAAYGITSATDMMTGRWNLTEELAAYREAAVQGCAVRLRLFLQWGAVFGKRGLGSQAIRELTADWPGAHVRVQGIKIFADGAIGSATAAIYGRYQSHAPTEGPRSNEDGRLIYAPERLNAMVSQAHEAGWPLAIHAIGDRAVDAVMDAYALTDAPSRHRVEHAMLLSDDQIERLQRLQVHVTAQPEFLVQFGHTYRRQLGEARAASLKRLRSLHRAGLSLSLNSDRPIVSGDPWLALRTATQRPEGFDPGENLDLETARIAHTQGGHVANGDAGQGTLEVGTWADLLVFAPGAKPDSLQLLPQQVLGPSLASTS